MRAVTPLTLVVLLTGCKEDVQKDVVDSGYGLSRFASCDDMRDHIEDAWVQAVVYSHYGYGYYGWGVDEDLSAGDDGSNAGGGGGPSEYSETNNQEIGVDEPDMVKTDGEHLYIIHDGQLSVVQSWPAEDTARVAELSLDGYPTSALLTDDGQLVVFGYDDEDAFYDEEQGWYSSATRVSVVDVSDPSLPLVTRSFAIEGSQVGARMVDGEIYLATQDWSYYPYAVWEAMSRDGLSLPAFDWWDASAEERDAAFAEAGELVRPYVADVLSKIETDALLPRILEDGAVSTLMGCRELYHPAEMNSTSTMTLLHLDLSAGHITGTGVMSEGWMPYASTESFYVAQTSWWWDAAEEPQTQIHRFVLDRDQTVYAGSGSVSGWVLNSFSMGEHDGHLRVATSDAGWGWGEDTDEPANNVFVLEVGEQSLDTVGEVRDIAPGERIYSARFVEDRGYVVTFEQIDPLFTLDLSDPTAPAVAGELKVPGYSSYLHPIGDDRILAVGMDGTEDGEITGLAVSLFDISDFSQPTLLDKYTLESDDWSWSQALYDHHAFTYFNDTLTIPAYTWSDDEGFSGMLVLDVDLDAGLSELGRVDHADMVADSECRYGRECSDYYWYAWLQRSVVVDDSLYTISDYGVKVNAHRAPEDEQARVLFNPAR